jgi:excinuclease ABC subunit A
MLERPAGSRWYALFEVAGREAATLRDQLFELRKKGFTRLFQAGRVFEFSTPESLLDIDFSKPVFALVDRLAIAPDLHQRLVDTIETCYRESGEVIFEAAAGGEQLRFNERFQCKTCGLEFNVPEPILFSFNSPFGACPRCQGFGNTIDFDMDRVIPDKGLTLDEGAVEPWTKPKHRSWLGNFRKHARNRVRFDVAYCDLTEAERDYVDEFIRRFFDHLETKKYKLHVRVFMSRYRGYALCPDCKGARLRKEALYVRVGGKNLAEVVRLNIAEAQQFFDSMELT